jgi:biopolymer transport protein ExbD
MWAKLMTRETIRARLRLILTVVPAVLLLSACSGSSGVVAVKVTIDSAGNYAVNERSVSRNELKDSLFALKPKNGVLAINLNVSASAPYQSVQHAMAVAGALEGRVAFVGNEKF